MSVEKDMESLTNQRKITEYVKEEAYKWLYNAIQAGDYQFTKNKASKMLLLTITQEEKVTQETYEEFLSCFENNPISYVTQTKKHRRKLITTEKMTHYFVECNGFMLPVGFMQTFFEDDYETDADRDAMLKTVTAYQLERQHTKWKQTPLDHSIKLDSLQENYPTSIGMHPLLLAKNLVHVVVTILLICLAMSFFKSVNFKEVMEQFYGNNFRVTDEIVLDETLESYILNADKALESPFNIGEYLNTYAVALMLNIVVLIIVIVRVFKDIKFCICGIRVLIYRIRIEIYKAYCSKIEGTGVDSMNEYFKEQIPAMVQGKAVNPEDFKDVPRELRYINALENADMDKFTASIERYDKKNVFSYKLEQLPKRKKSWIVGIVSSAILLLAVCIIDFPPHFELVVGRLYRALF